MEWLLCLLFMIFGAGIVLVVQFIFLNWYIEGAPKGETPPPPPKDSQLPKELNALGISPDNGDCAAAVSLALQFLFQELKHAPAPLAWLNRKLHQEMVDLLTRTTSGKLFESLTVRRIAMGQGAPRVQWAGVQKVDMGEGNRLRTVDLLVDIQYSGGFTLAVDAGMLLGKTACLDIEVEQLSGRARVRFTRQPYTHWSLSFIGAPRLDLRARPLKGKLAALLQAHARRALQRRHTLPNYTIRYKPFFTKIDPSQLDIPSEDSSIKIQGLLEVTLSEVTRLFTDSWSDSKSSNRTVYCTLSLDSNPWISLKEDDECSIFTLDIVIHKERSQQLGTVFKQVNLENGKSSVIIETVVPLSAAYKADLRRGDILIAVDNKIVTNMNQVAKVVKSISRPCFTVRIERRAKKSFEKNKTIKKEDSLTVSSENEDTVLKRPKSNSFSFRKMSEMLESARTVGQESRALLRGASSNTNIQDVESKSSIVSSSESQETKSRAEESPAKTSNTITFSKNTDSIQMPIGFGLRKRRCSVENRTSSDSSNSSTPTASNPGTPSKRRSEQPIYAKINNENYNLDTSPSPEIQNGSSFTDITDDAIQDLPGTPRISIVKIQDTSPERRPSVMMLQNHCSKKLPLGEDMIFGEKVCFTLNRNHRYLNLNVWGASEKSEDVLLAYLNIPLQTVLKECKKSKVGQLIRSFILLPPDVNLTVTKNNPLSTHSGFEPCLCYGDILLEFSWLSQDSQSSTSGKLSKEPSQDNKQIQDLDGDCAEYEFIEANEEDLKQKATPEKQARDQNHDFLRTHFHRSTQCDFCGKKIWLKDAVQCRNCAMCCHKKCVAKCLSSGKCQPPGLAMQGDSVSSPSQEVPSFNVSQAPDFLMPSDVEDRPPLTPTLSQESLKDGKEEGLLGRASFAGLLGGLRRVGSAHSLAPPGQSSSSARSLPPSPHHSPRRQSPDEEHAWTLIEALAESGQLKAEELLQPLLGTKIPPDILLARARDHGPQLLASLPFEDRSEKIGSLIIEVRSALDDESLKLSGIQSSLSSKNTQQQERVKLTKAMEESEERSHALTALLLHCCSALQSANRNSISE